MSQSFVRSALVSMIALASAPALAQNRPGNGPVIRQAPVVTRPNFRGGDQQEPAARPSNPGIERRENPQPLPPVQAPPQRPSQPAPAPGRVDRGDEFNRGDRFGGQRPGGDFNRGGDVGRHEGQWGQQPSRGTGPIPLPGGHRDGDFGRGDYGHGGWGRGGYGRGDYGRPYPPVGRPPVYPQYPPQYPQPPIKPPVYGEPPYGQPPIDQAVIPGLNNVYRFFNGTEHFLTLNLGEGYQAGFQIEGLAFRTFTDPAGGARLGLFRCLALGMGHFATNDPNCEGQQQEGLYGFVDRVPSPQAPREVVRCLRGVDHLITLNRGECINAGYVIEAILGYVP